MATEHIDIPSYGQMDDLVRAVQSQASSLRALARDNSTAVISDFRQLQKMVKTGEAKSVLSVGDQIVTKYTENGKTYDMPWDIVHFGDAKLADGSTYPAMYLQSHYATLDDMQFDNAEALYYAEDGLAAGKYYVKTPSNWGSNAHAGEYIIFTLTKAVPAKGQIRGLIQMPDVAQSTWRISTYESSTATDPIETVTPVISTSSSGTSLGEWKNDARNGNLNGMHQTGYGLNHYGQSAVRQYLNSDAAKGEWWKPQNNWDVPPNQAGSVDGFMKGLAEDFKDVIVPIEVKTTENNASESGATYSTYDRFFLPSLKEEYINTQSGNEGEIWEYWKQRNGTGAVQPWYKGTPTYITYDLASHSSARYVRLRSASLGDAYDAWYVTASGGVSYWNAWRALRCAPACAIVGI